MINFKKYRPIFKLTLISFPIYLTHKLVFFLNENNSNLQGFHFPIEAIYGFFFSCSLIIVFVLIKVNEKNIDNVGFTFLLITCLKIGISYLVLSPILNSENQNIRIEKINFFIIFAFFLTIETIITARILNKKQ